VAREIKARLYSGVLEWCAVTLRYHVIAMATAVQHNTAEARLKYAARVNDHCGAFHDISSRALKEVVMAAVSPCSELQPSRPSKEFVIAKRLLYLMVNRTA
jgi:hypothetical protein